MSIPSTFQFSHWRCRCTLNEPDVSQAIFMWLALKARLQEDAHLDTDLAPIMTPHESRLICNSSDPVRPCA